MCRVIGSRSSRAASSAALAVAIAFPPTPYLRIDPDSPRRDAIYSSHAARFLGDRSPVPPVLAGQRTGTSIPLPPPGRTKYPLIMAILSLQKALGPESVRPSCASARDDDMSFSRCETSRPRRGASAGDYLHMAVASIGDNPAITGHNGDTQVTRARHDQPICGISVQLTGQERSIDRDLGGQRGLP